MPRIHGEPAASWWANNAPTNGPISTGGIWVGSIIEFLTDGRLNGFRFYRSNGDSNTHFALLMGHQEESGRLWVAAPFMDVQAPAAGWQQTWLRPWFRVKPNVDYRLIIFSNGAAYHRTPNAFAGGPVDHGDIRFINGFQSTALAIATISVTTNNNANGVDVLFQPD